MSKRLPEFIEPLRLVDKRKTLQGQLALSKMKRLASSLSENASDKSDVEVELHFGVDDSGLPNIRGKLVAMLQLTCQRCMQPMSYQVEAQVSLAIVQNDVQAKKLPERYEPILVGEDEVSLSELVEDELLLALPAIAMHEMDQCPVSDELKLLQAGKISTDANSGVVSNEMAGTRQESEKPNPFAVLEQLKKK